MVQFNSDLTLYTSHTQTIYEDKKIDLCLCSSEKLKPPLVAADKVVTMFYRLLPYSMGY